MKTVFEELFTTGSAKGPFTIKAERKSAVGTLFEDNGLGDLLPINVGLSSRKRLQRDHHCTQKRQDHSRNRRRPGHQATMLTR